MNKLVYQRMRETGRLGEQLAAHYLAERGYQIIEQNVYTRFGEIDIVARQQNVLHLCEVKTVTTGHHRAATALTPQKRRRLRASAACLSHYSDETCTLCCDLITVEVHPHNGGVRVGHVHDQF